MSGPLRDRVLVKRVVEQEQRIGGIIIPDTAKEKPQQATVVTVGRGRLNDDGRIIPLDVRRRAHWEIRRHRDQAGRRGLSDRARRRDLGVAEGVPELAAV